MDPALALETIRDNDDGETKTVSIQSLLLDRNDSGEEE